MDSVLACVCVRLRALACVGVWQLQPTLMSVTKGVCVCLRAFACVGGEMNACCEVY